MPSVGLTNSTLELMSNLGLEHLVRISIEVFLFIINGQDSVESSSSSKPFLEERSALLHLLG